MRHLAAVFAVTLCLSVTASAIPELPRDDYPQLVLAQADPTDAGRFCADPVYRGRNPVECAAAETPAPTPAADPELETVVGSLSKVFAADGTVNWILAAPLLVWLLVFGLRKFGGQFIPWFKTKAGGITLALTSGLAFAFLSYALTGGVFTAGAVVAIAVKTLYGFLGSMGLQSGGKNLKEHIAAKGDAAAAEMNTVAKAHAKLAELGRGPQR